MINKYRPYVEALFPGANLTTCEVTRKVDDDTILGPKEDMVRFEVTEQYDRPAVKFDHLTLLSELFGTTKIDFGDGESSPGCETCDYGSSYGVEITAKRVNFEMELPPLRLYQIAGDMLDRYGEDTLDDVRKAYIAEVATSE